jgi:hypothetical protein
MHPRLWRSTQRAGLRGKIRQGKNIMATMKAVQIHEYGDVDVLKYEDVERPEPQAGEVLVRVQAVGINQVDAVSRRFPVPVTSGAKGLPYILGWDIADAEETLIEASHPATGQRGENTVTYQQ